MTGHPPAVRFSPLLRLGWRLHAWLYRVTGGRLGSRVGPWPALLLITRGRKSGTPRTVSLNYLTDDGRLIVTASHAGEDRHPAWWLNLLDDPRAEVQTGTDRHPVTARELDGPERERLWARIVATDASYAEYERRTRRRIPVVALERQPTDER